MCKQCSRSVCILFSEVLVGEYTLAQDPDCQGSFCLPSPQHLNIEKVIPHEDWSEENFKQGHDIALIRVQGHIKLNVSKTKIDVLTQCVNISLLGQRSKALCFARLSTLEFK